MDAIVTDLVGMGFAQNRAEKAVFFTKKKGVQQALDWLLEHQEDADIDEPITIDESQMAEFGLGGAAEDGSVVTQQQSTMTPEEKAAAVEALKAKIAAKRAEKAAAAAVDDIAKEKERREMGQKSAQTYAERKEAQDRMAAQQAKRQKQEEQAYLASLKEKVRLEREERAAKLSGAAQPSSTPSQPPAAAPTAAEPASSSAAPKTINDFTECQLQIRLTNGQQLKASFAPTQTIADVIQYVTKNRTDGQAPFVLMTTFPKVTFDSNLPDQTCLNLERGMLTFATSTDLHYLLSARSSVFLMISS